MELIRGIANLKDQHLGCVATIGNFDGVHLGHQEILRRLVDHANQLKLPALAILFEPHPAEYFAHGATTPARLTNLGEKLPLLAACGIHRVLCLRCDERLINRSAQSFVVDLLVERLAVKGIMIGEDFRFGKDRAGDYSLLGRLGQRHGFALWRAPPVCIANARVSSSAIRQCLSAGSLSAAAELLGRPYSISGRVVHGEQQGRALGTPTINIPLHRRRAPLAGIYAARISGLGATCLPAVAYLGARPIIEAHVFDFDLDCYGKRLRIDMLAKIRDDRVIDSVDELKAQISSDCVQARQLLDLPV